METKYEGFVIYNKSLNANKAYGVVSPNFECQAKSIEIPTKLKEFVVEIEDKRFYKHQ